MAKLSVYYDRDLEGILTPVWMILEVNDNDRIWERSILWMSLEAPFKRHRAEDFNNEEMVASVLLSELTVNLEAPNKFGINIVALNKRILSLGADPSEINKLVIRICDIAEVLEVDVRRYYDWR